MTKLALDDSVFKTIVKNTPLISIDLIIENSNSEILLGERVNRPARGCLFVPGGRIRKDETINEALTDNQKMLLDMLRNDPTITQKEIIERVSLSRSTVQRMIKELSELGRLERVGSKKTGSWIVKE